MFRKALIDTEHIDLETLLNTLGLLKPEILKLEEEPQNYTTTAKWIKKQETQKKGED